MPPIIASSIRSKLDADCALVEEFGWLKSNIGVCMGVDVASRADEEVVGKALRV